MPQPQYDASLIPNRIFSGIELCPKACDTHTHSNNHDAEHTRRRGPPDSFTGNFGVRVHLQARMPPSNLYAVCWQSWHEFALRRLLCSSSYKSKTSSTLFQSLDSIVQTPNLFAVTRHRERFEFKRYQGLETPSPTPDTSIITPPHCRLDVSFTALSSACIH